MKTFIAASLSKIAKEGSHIVDIDFGDFERRKMAARVVIAILAQVKIFLRPRTVIDQIAVIGSVVAVAPIVVAEIIRKPSLLETLHQIVKFRSGKIDLEWLDIVFRRQRETPVKVAAGDIRMA